MVIYGIVLFTSLFLYSTIIKDQEKGLGAEILLCFVPLVNVGYMIYLIISNHNNKK